MHPCHGLDPHGTQLQAHAGIALNRLKITNTSLPCVPLLQAIGHSCCPASKARLRLTCRSWHLALATQFSTLYLGPGNPACLHASTGQQQQQGAPTHVPAWLLGDSLHRAFPAVTALQLTASSSREYQDSFTQVCITCCTLPVSST